MFGLNIKTSTSPRERGQAQRLPRGKAERASSQLLLTEPVFNTNISLVISSVLYSVHMATGVKPSPYVWLLPNGFIESEYGLNCVPHQIQYVTM